MPKLKTDTHNNHGRSGGSVVVVGGVVVVVVVRVVGVLVSEVTNRCRFQL